MATRDIREVVEKCAAASDIELDEFTLSVVLMTLDYMHLFNDPWTHGFTGTADDWIARVQRVAREALAHVLSSRQGGPEAKTEAHCTRSQRRTQ